MFNLEILTPNKENYFNFDPIPINLVSPILKVPTTTLTLTPSFLSVSFKYTSDITG
jgi:hypothetical protein